MLASQETLTGMIMEANDKNERIGLAGANVYWLDTTIGTVTGVDGNFTIDYSREYTKLVISYVGFKTDTLTINEPKMVHHW
ncbi:MAG: TonB-dependent receptor, partial [Flavobacteriaceae bacterium]|nr:TonB-dependent receptor [Flavobacteriaceae bacterium]